MKAGWQSKTLGDICEIERGGSPRPIDKFITTDPNGINWIKIGDATASGKYIYKTGQKIKPEGVKRSRMVYKGDFILSNSMSFGRPYIMRTTGCIHDGWLVLHQPKVDPDYLYHILGSDLVFNQFDRLAAGSTVRNLNIGLAKSVVIPYPPLPEQRRIVGILDEAFAGIATAKANAEKNRQNARTIFESHLNAIVLEKKWKWTILGNLCDGVEYGSSAKSRKEGKVPVLRMGNIQDGQLDWESLVYTDDSDEIAKYLLKHNDVLFNRTNSPELVGKTAIYKSEMPAIFAGYLIRIHRKKDVLDADYLTYFLNSQIALDYGKTVMISSVNQANINGAKLKGYPIPVPSISDQRIIVKTLNDLQEETRRLETIYQQKLTALDALKKSLLHQAFTGEL